MIMANLFSLLKDIRFVPLFYLDIKAVFQTSFINLVDLHCTFNPRAPRVTQSHFDDLYQKLKLAPYQHESVLP